MSQIPFSIETVTQKQWDEHALSLMRRYGVKNAKQFEREILSMMQSNSDKAYEKFAKRANIQVLEDENIAYGLRLRLAVVAVTMTFSCKTPQEYKAFLPNVEIFCIAKYQESIED